jgi:hypothetical protein
MMNPPTMIKVKIMLTVKLLIYEKLFRLFGISSRATLTVSYKFASSIASETFTTVITKTK